MRRKIKMTLNGCYYVANNNCRLDICGEGYAKFFRVEEHELEEEITLVISDRKVKGAFKAAVPCAESCEDTYIDGSRHYITVGTRQQIIKAIGADPDYNQTLYFWVEVTL